MINRNFVSGEAHWDGYHRNSVPAFLGGFPFHAQYFEAVHDQYNTAMNGDALHSYQDSYPPANFHYMPGGPAYQQGNIKSPILEYVNEGHPYFQGGEQPAYGGMHFQVAPHGAPANQPTPGIYMNGNPVPFPSHFLPEQHMNMQYPPAAHPQQPNKNNGLNPFENPLQPVQKRPPVQQAFANPYPSQQFMKKQPSGIQSVLNQFKTQDGSIDINKMMNTAGQMMSTFSQVSSIVKGFGGKLKV